MFPNGSLEQVMTHQPKRWPLTSGNESLMDIYIFRALHWLAPEHKITTYNNMSLYSYLTSDAKRKWDTARPGKLSTVPVPGLDLLNDSTNCLTATLRTKHRPKETACLAFQCRQFYSDPVTAVATKKSAFLSALLLFRQTSGTEAHVYLLQRNASLDSYCLRRLELSRRMQSLCFRKRTLPTDTHISSVSHRQDLWSSMQ